MNATDSPAIELRDPAIYRHWTRVSIRFSDEDRMGHVNNAIYLAWLEACRVDYLYRFFAASDALDAVLARVTVDYLKETRYPGEVDVGGVFTRIGTRSITSAYAVFRDRQCLVTAEAVNVFFDPRSRSSIQPPDPVRQALVSEIEQAELQRRAR